MLGRAPNAAAHLRHARHTIHEREVHARAGAGAVRCSGWLDRAVGVVV
jgi:hypothetical protein